MEVETPLAGYSSLWEPSSNSLKRPLGEFTGDFRDGGWLWETLILLCLNMKDKVAQLFHPTGVL